MDAAVRETVFTPVSPEVQFSTYGTFINTTELPDYFKGCVYVLKDHAILTPGGHLLDQGRFKSKFGGAVFSLDSLGNKTTRNAWEALTENITLRFPKVDETTFAPELAPGEIADKQGTSVVNTYWPIKVERQAGDPTLFVQHVYKILPDGDDARILLTYLAALVQNPGHKFQWCPLIQGPKGNGKNDINRVHLGSRWGKIHPLTKRAGSGREWIQIYRLVTTKTVYWCRGNLLRRPPGGDGDVKTDDHEPPSRNPGQRG